jgi:hypothetical protein
MSSSTGSPNARGSSWRAILVGSNDVAAAAKEVFGPAATIIRAQDEHHSVQLANDTDYGLSSAVHTRDAERGTRFAFAVVRGNDPCQRQPAERGGRHRLRRREAVGAWSVRRHVVGLGVHHPLLGVGAARAAQLSGRRLTSRGGTSPGTGVRACPADQPGAGASPEARLSPRRPILHDRDDFSAISTEN